jgi:hypothetical protein
MVVRGPFSLLLCSRRRFPIYNSAHGFRSTSDRESRPSQRISAESGCNAKPRFKIGRRSWVSGTAPCRSTRYNWKWCRLPVTVVTHVDLFGPVTNSRFGTANLPASWPEHLALTRCRADRWERSHRGTICKCCPAGSRSVRLRGKTCPRHQDCTGSSNLYQMYAHFESLILPCQSKKMALAPKSAVQAFSAIRDGLTHRPAGSLRVAKLPLSRS